MRNSWESRMPKSLQAIVRPLLSWGIWPLVGGGFFVLVLGGAGLFAGHGTIEAKGFCNTCHSAYYDAKEYTFNDKVGMKKPSGVLSGCAECHPQPYAEFKKSVHFTTSKSERRPGCTNCHTEPHSIYSWYNYMYWQPEEWKKVQLSIHDEQAWEQRTRPDLAGKSRAKFIKSDSNGCRGCHDFAAIEPTRKRGKRAHQDAKEKGRTNCIACHYNLVHKEAPLTQAFSQAIKELGAE